MDVKAGFMRELREICDLERDPIHAWNSFCSNQTWLQKETRIPVERLRPKNDAFMDEEH